MQQYKKGNLRVSLFLCSLLAIVCSLPHFTAAQTYSEQALQQLSQQPVWSTLLHTQNQQRFIQDSQFYFSYHNFSLFNELTATLQAFAQPTPLNNQHPICRFPARFLWLQQQLSFQAADFPAPSCKAYQTFQKKAPAQAVQLVFASENIVSPSSMMGHVFLKISGKNAAHRQVSHAITYFTPLDTLNIPKMMYQSFAGGLQGVFALQPYQLLKENYLNKEERNLWEYTLNLDTFQKQFLQAHIWELKAMKSDYFFVDYNCATVTYFLLALNAPEIWSSYQHWVAPVDVVKTATKHKLISQTHVLTSDRWKIYMLLDQLEYTSSLKRRIDTLQHTEINAFIQSLSPEQRLLTTTYIHYLTIHHLPSKNIQTLQTLKQRLLDIQTSYVLNYTDYKQPIKSPGNSQLGISIGAANGQTFLDLSFLPAATRITDDQRQFFATRELLMGDTHIRLDNQGNISLNQFTLYGMRNLNPWNTWTRALSGQWKLGLENQTDEIGNQHLVLNLDGGLGYTTAIGEDIRLSALYNVGMATDKQLAYLYHGPNVVLQVNEIADMKLTAEYNAWFNVYASKSRTDYTSLCQSYYAKQDSTLLACYTQTKNNTYTNSTFKLNWQQHF